jgi:hypothetical protein
MTAAGWIALAITVFGAFSYAAGSILQAVGARRSTGMVRTLGHPLYLLGVVCDLLAWGGSMVALRELAVYLVESVLAGSLALTIVAARVILKSRLRRRDVVAISVSVVALTVLAMSAGQQETVTASTAFKLWFCGAALVTALIGWGATEVASPGATAALAGLSLGGAALAGRALTLPPEAMRHVGATALAIVTQPLVGALAVFAATGMLLYTAALQRGQVGPVTAVLWIGEVIAPSAVALVLLGDTVRPGWSLPATVAGLVTVAAAVLLATAPASNATARQQDALPAAAPRPALPAAERPALPSAAPLASHDRIIWWGAPPIWRPPARAMARVHQPVAELTWRPAQPAEWMWAADPQPAFVRQAEALRPAAPGLAYVRPAETPRPAAPEPARPQPWHDL